MKVDILNIMQQEGAVPGEEGGLPVKVADKLRALEMLYKHLGLGDGAKTEGVVIVDSES